jgi:hypothetical protein
VIPELAVREWSAAHQWPLPSQVEQDLLLSRAICEIANHPYLGSELVYGRSVVLHHALEAPHRIFSLRSAPGKPPPGTPSSQKLGSFASVSHP